MARSYTKSGWPRHVAACQKKGYDGLMKKGNKGRCYKFTDRKYYGKTRRPPRIIHIGKNGGMYYNRNGRKVYNQYMKNRAVVRGAARRYVR
jgi:hypothetical protein